MPGLKLAAAMMPLLVGAVGAPASAQAQQTPAMGEEIAAAGVDAGLFLMETLRAGQARAPAVVAGLGALTVILLIATAMYFARRLAGDWFEERAAPSSARSAAEAAALPRLANAWIDVDGPARRRLRIAGEMVRIGRDEENDLRLDDANVHRQHAVIQRTSDAEFVVVDVSGVRGNGVAVNGRRMARARLRDGDLIELGTSRVRFRCESISHAMSA